MDTEKKNELDNKHVQSDALPETELQSTANESQPNKRIRRQATQEQLDNPFHGVKLKQVLERLVTHYGWEYLGERTNLRCFIFNPTMKSSLGFLRRTAWAREHVEDLYLEMVEKKRETNTTLKK